MDDQVQILQAELESTIKLLEGLKPKNMKILSKKENCDLKKSEMLEKHRIDLKSLKNQMIQQVQASLNSFSTSFDQTVDSIIDESIEETSKTMPKNIFSQKVHKTRSSLLMKMHRNENVRTVYHIFISIMLIMCIEETVSNYIKTGDFFDMPLFRVIFKDLHLIIPFWFLMTSFAFLIVPLVKFIHRYQIRVYFWVFPYFCILVTLNLVPSLFCLFMEFPMASGLIVTCEMVRMSLKVHSYLREKLLFGNGENEYAKFIPDFLLKKGVTIESLNIPDIKIESLSIELKKFGFFFFAPTLIYRDIYPRTNYSDRGSRILLSLLNVLGTMSFTYVLFSQYCYPYFRQSWNSRWSLHFVLTSWFKAMIPGTLLLVMLFYGMLHSWFNLWAEILRFGDREFYQDWWNVTNYADYYRKWNIVVHEWLFHYIYQDTIRFNKGKSPYFLGFFLVFFVSAGVHELILTVSMRFSYPILMVMFGGPGALNSLIRTGEKRALNIIVWSGLFVGNGLLVVFYSWEHFARQSLDLSEKYGWKAFFIPHSWGFVEL